MSAQIELQFLEPSQHYLNASPNEKTSQAHHLAKNPICNQAKKLVLFAKTLSSQKVLACSQHCASFQMLLSALHKSISACVENYYRY